MSLLFTPISIKGQELKNRVVMPPMANNMADENGFVTDALIEHYVARAKAQVGMIIVEHAYVDKLGQLNEGQLSITGDDCIEGLRELTEAVHRAGGSIGLQITHAGASAKEKVIGAQPVAPSDVPRPGRDEVPRAMSKKEIKVLVKEFATAAKRVTDAGFDMVELHGAHGYLINQFNSPLTNNRTDQYGGNLENRFRFLIETLEACRAAVGNTFPIWLRLGVDDNDENGLTIQDSCEISPRLVMAGVDCIDVSGGLGGISRRGDTSPGFYAPFAQQVKKAVDVPIMVTGGITDAATAEEILRNDQADLIGIGRALLREPDWVQKAKAALIKA